MSEETKPTENMHTITIAEYNELKAQASRVQALEASLGEEKTKYSTLNSEYEIIKSKKKIEGPSREDIEKELRDQYGNQLTEAQQKAEGFEAKLRKMLVTDKVIGALGDKITPSAKRWLTQEIEKECDLEGDYDNHKIIIKDDKGTKRWSSKTPNAEMNLDEYGEELSTRYPEFFKSSARAGDGDNGTKVSTPVGTVSLSSSDVQRMSQGELNKIAKENPKLLSTYLKENGQ